MSPSTLALAVVAALLAAAVGAYAALGGPSRASPARAGSDGRAPVRVTGHVTGLVPGASAHLRGRVRNRTGDPLRVVWVKARVRSASPACDRVNVRTKRIRPRYVVAAHATRRLRIPVRMKAWAPDACQGALFPLRYRARVARVGPGR